MKKATLILFASMLVFAACKKDYTCACKDSYTISGMGTIDSNYTFQTGKQTKKNAKTICKGSELTSTISIMGFTTTQTTTCELK